MCSVLCHQRHQRVTLDSSVTLWCLVSLSSVTLWCHCLVSLSSATVLYFILPEVQLIVGVSDPHSLGQIARLKPDYDDYDQ